MRKKKLIHSFTAMSQLRRRVGLFWQMCLVSLFQRFFYAWLFSKGIVFNLISALSLSVLSVSVSPFTFALNFYGDALSMRLSTVQLSIFRKFHWIRNLVHKTHKIGKSFQFVAAMRIFNIVEHDTMQLLHFLVNSNSNKVVPGRCQLPKQFKKKISNEKLHTNGRAKKCFCSVLAGKELRVLVFLFLAQIDDFIRGANINLIVWCVSAMIVY